MPMPLEERIRELMREHVYGKTAGERLKHIKCVLFLGQGFLFPPFFLVQPDWLPCM